MIIEENKNKVKIKVNRFFLELLRSNNIYTTRTGMNPKIRGGYVERWKEGDVVEIFKKSRCEAFSTIAQGNCIYTCGSFSSIASSLPINTVVGRYSSVGPNCTRVGFRHPVEAVSMSSAVFNFSRENVAGYMDLVEMRDGERPSPTAVPTPQPQSDTIKIGNDVWIGGGVTISGGVTIGDGAIIAGKSVVTKSVKPYEIVAGIPAEFKRYRFPRDVVDGLLESEWWNYELSDLYNLDFSSPDVFLNNFSKNKKSLRLYKPKSISLSDVIL